MRPKPLLSAHSLGFKVSQLVQIWTPGRWAPPRRYDRNHRGSPSKRRIRRQLARLRALATNRNPAPSRSPADSAIPAPGD